jgi:very-short-patch-repair endonuclease
LWEVALIEISEAYEEPEETSPSAEAVARSKALYQQLVHPSEARTLVRAESPIEARLMSLVLDASPGIDATAYYVLLPELGAVQDFLDRAAEERNLPCYLIFPQVTIGSFRVDFVVAARAPSIAGPYHPFIVEADGAAYHGRHVDQIIRDMERERSLRRQVRWDIVRFSGAEILYASESVGDVLEAYVMAAVPDPYCDPGSPRDELRHDIRRLALKLSGLPVNRHEYVHPACANDLAQLQNLVSAFGMADGNSN